MSIEKCHLCGQVFTDHDFFEQHLDDHMITQQAAYDAEIASMWGKYTEPRKGTARYYREKLDDYYDQERKRKASRTCQAKLDAMTNPRERQKLIAWCHSKGIEINEN